MYDKIIKKLITLSFLLFLVSLCLDAFYLNETQVPYPAISCLLMGIIGFFAAPAWFANPLYLLSITQTNKKASVIYALLASCISLSFLLHTSILTDEGGGRGLITAYGWGYYLWVLSQFILSFSLLFKHRSDYFRNGDLISTTTYLALVSMPIFLGSLAFGYHYFFSKSSHYEITKFRDNYMNAHCPLAKEVFYELPGEVNGIYLSEYSSVRGEWFMGPNVPLNPIKFWEQIYTFSGEKMLTRFYYTDSYEKGISKLDSEYSVITTELTKEVDRKYDIRGTSVTIVDNKSKRKIAETVSYLTQNRVCNPNQLEKYSEEGFVVKALRLDHLP